MALVNEKMFSIKNIKSKTKTLSYRMLNLRWSCCKSRHPSLKQSPPKLEWILLGEEKEDALENSELIKEDATANSEDEVAELVHDECEIMNRENLSRDDTGDANRWDPHDQRHHPHDDVIDHDEEVYDRLGSLANWSENSAEGEAEENDSQSICTRSENRIIVKMIQQCA